MVFVEFASEAEADKQHAKLQPLIADGQLNQVNFVGEKEREFQSNNRSLDNTRLAAARAASERVSRGFAGRHT